MKAWQSAPTGSNSAHDCLSGVGTVPLSGWRRHFALSGQALTHMVMSGIFVLHGVERAMPSGLVGLAVTVLWAALPITVTVVIGLAACDLAAAPM